MKTALTLGLAALVLALAGSAWVRLAPHDVARWHADPRHAPDPVTPNFARRSVTLPGRPADLMARFRAVATGTQVLADDGAHVTLVSRTALMGYPDYVSALVEEVPEGARLTVLSRSRFGHSDLGTNARRLDDWLGRM